MPSPPYGGPNIFNVPQGTDYPDPWEIGLPPWLQQLAGLGNWWGGSWGDYGQGMPGSWPNYDPNDPYANPENQSNPSPLVSDNPLDPTRPDRPLDTGYRTPLIEVIADMIRGLDNQRGGGQSAPYERPYRTPIIGVEGRVPERMPPEASSPNMGPVPVEQRPPDSIPTGEDTRGWPEMPQMPQSQDLFGGQSGYYPLPNISTTPTFNSQQGATKPIAQGGQMSTPTMDEYLKWMMDNRGQQGQGQPTIGGQTPGIATTGGPPQSLGGSLRQALGKGLQNATAPDTLELAIASILGRLIGGNRKAGMQAGQLNVQQRSRRMEDALKKAQEARLGKQDARMERQDTREQKKFETDTIVTKRQQLRLDEQDALTASVDMQSNPDSKLSPAEMEIELKRQFPQLSDLRIKSVVARSGTEAYKANLAKLKDEFGIQESMAKAIAANPNWTPPKDMIVTPEMQVKIDEMKALSAELQALDIEGKRLSLKERQQKLVNDRYISGSAYGTLSLPNPDGSLRQVQGMNPAVESSLNAQATNAARMNEEFVNDPATGQVRRAKPGEQGLPSSVAQTNASLGIRGQGMGNAVTKKIDDDAMELWKLQNRDKSPEDMAQALPELDQLRDKGRMAQGLPTLKAERLNSLPQQEQQRTLQAMVQSLIQLPPQVREQKLQNLAATGVSQQLISSLRAMMGAMPARPNALP